MARLNVNITAGTSPTRPAHFNATLAPSIDPVTLTDNADTLAVTAVASVAAAKVASAVQETAAIALDALVDLVVAAKCQTASVAGVEDALNTLQADGALPTEAHVDTADTAWDVLKAEITALNTTITNAKTASATHETDDIALDALVDTSVTDTVATEASTTLAEAGVGADMQVSVNLATITSRSQLRAYMKVLDQYFASISMAP